VRQHRPGEQQEAERQQPVEADLRERLAHDDPGHDQRGGQRRRREEMQAVERVAQQHDAGDGEHLQRAAGGQQHPRDRRPHPPPFACSSSPRKRM
jgi:hypothetical protein